MNFSGTSLAVNPKIKTLDQGIIRTCQERIVAKIRAEFYPGFDDNVISIEYVHELSPNSVLIQVNMWIKLSADEIVEAECDPVESENKYSNIKKVTLFVFNFVSELHQIHITEINSCDTLMIEILVAISNQQVDYPSHISFDDYSIYYESVNHSKRGLTFVRLRHVLKYWDNHGKNKAFVVCQKEKVGILRETKTGNSIWYFPDTETKFL
jgi:hypothetical protein